MKATAGNWLASLNGLIPIPEPFRCADQDRAAARAALRCDDETLDLLVREGLPCEGTEGAELFDEYDLYNLALYSGTGRSLAEYAALFVGRLAHAEPESWLEPKAWSLRLRARCESPCQCGADEQWQVMRLMPEVYGGRVREVLGHPAPTITPTSLEVPGEAGRIEVTWRVSTSGVRRRVVNGVLRDLMRWILEDFRFQVLPPKLASSVDHLESLGAAECVAASFLMEKECQRLGIAARVEPTLMLGVVAFLGHCRLEVIDSDGAEKALDPGLCAAARLSGRRADAFEEFCHGSTGNRMIPITGVQDMSFVRHGGNDRCPAAVSIRVSGDAAA